MSTTSWGVHLLAILKALGAWIYMSFSFPGCLGVVNLGSASSVLPLHCSVLTMISSFSRISILVYYSTKAEQRQRMTSERELSTRRNGKRITSLSFSFPFLSVLTGLLNFGGAFFRSRHIQLLEIPTTWLTKAAGDAGNPILLAKLIEAEWIVAVNDWGSLFLSIAFFLAGCFNFATVRQLRLRSYEEEEGLLPLTVKKSDIAGFEGVMNPRTFAPDEKQQISGEVQVEGRESRLGSS